MKKRALSLLLAAVLMVTCMAGCGSNTATSSQSDQNAQDTTTDSSSDDASIVIMVGHSAQSTEPYQLGLEAMDEKLQELTDGKVKLEIYPNCTLGSEREMVESVQAGNLQMCIAPTAVLSNFDENFKIFDLPYLFTSRDHAYKVWDSDLGQQIASTLTDKNMKLLSYYEAGVRHLMTKTPVNSIDDLKGLKIRTMENDIHLAAWTAFGANPTPMAYNELYTALEQGVVDGAEAANTNYYSQAFYEVSNNWAQISWLIMGCGLVVNQEWYDSLDADIQDAIVEAAAYSAGIEREDYQTLDKECYDKLVEAGVNVTEPDLEPFKTAAKQVWEQYADEVGGMDLINQIEAMAS